jgi:hypothetical protein
MAEVYEIEMGGQTVVIKFTPATDSPFKKADVGTASITVEGVPAGDFPYNRASFVKLPFPGL